MITTFFLPMCMYAQNQLEGGIGCSSGSTTTTTAPLRGVEVEVVERALPLVDVVLSPLACLCIWPIMPFQVGRGSRCWLCCAVCVIL